MISGTMIALYMIATFAVGAIGTLVLFLWLFGSAARTIGLSHMFGDPVVQVPTKDRRWEFHRIKKTDEENRYFPNTDEEGEKPWLVDPDDVLIAGGKIPLVTCFNEYVNSVSPIKSISAEAAEASGSEKEEVEVQGISTNWNNLRNKMTNMIGAKHYAGMWASGIEANRPLDLGIESEGLDTGKVLKFSGVAMGLVLVIVGIYMAVQMGWI